MDVKTVMVSWSVQAAVTKYQTGRLRQQKLTLHGFGGGECEIQAPAW